MTALPATTLRLVETGGSDLSESEDVRADKSGPPIMCFYNRDAARRWHRNSSRALTGSTSVRSE